MNDAANRVSGAPKSVARPSGGGHRTTQIRCVRCKRKLPRYEVLGYTHLLEWTWVCRNSNECDQVRRGEHDPDA